MKKFLLLVLPIVLLKQNYIMSINKATTIKVMNVAKSVNLNTFSLKPPRNPGSTKWEKDYWSRDKYVKWISFEDLRGDEIVSVKNLVVNYEFTTNSSYVHKKGAITANEKLKAIANIIKIKSKLDFWFDAWSSWLWAKATVGSDLLSWSESDESKNVWGAFYQQNFKINISFDYQYR